MPRATHALLALSIIMLIEPRCAAATSAQLTATTSTFLKALSRYPRRRAAPRARCRQRSALLNKSQLPINSKLREEGDIETENNDVCAAWEKLCSEHQEALDAYYKAFSVVPKILGYLAQILSHTYLF